MGHHIAIIEDDPAIRRLVTFLLVHEGFEVTAHETVQHARDAWQVGGYPELLILDLMLPDEDGLSLCRSLREAPEAAHLPILALTARDQTVDKYEAYNAGFDGYLVKPFDPLELIYKIRAFLRLTSREGEGVPTELGPASFRLAPARFTVVVNGTDITLTRLETALLTHLMQHPGEVFSAEALAETVLFAHKGQVRTVDAVHAHIRNLRGKLEPDPKQPTRIRTMGRRGYYFDA
ncbi:MAG: response regulator transcription factor [Candidatus Sericytochromatia bacterium]|nr:response regulator transcription factor [Candidatus Sericytochromatia bacterium]